MCREWWWGHCPWIVYIFVNLFFNVVFCVCSFVVVFSQPDVVNVTWITGHIHRSIVDKIDPTSEDVEMVKKNTLSITMGYMFLWNVIRRIYLPCLQLISKKYFWWTVTRTPPFWGGGLNVEEWLMMTFVMENCLLDLFVVLDLDFRTDLNW
jgi:hypothetical protein